MKNGGGDNFLQIRDKVRKSNGRRAATVINRDEQGEVLAALNYVASKALIINRK